MKKYIAVLTIAGSDSSGGSGLQADLKTFSALGCYGMTVLTCAVAMNTKKIYGKIAVDPEFINLQLQALYDDIHIHATKTGMLYTEKIIKVVSDFFQNKKTILVVDPVMTAKVGDLLLEQDAVESLKNNLIPLATLITPNIPEAQYLLGRKITHETMEQASKDLAQLGAKSVLLKGGHLTAGHSNDCLYEKETDSITWLESSRVDTTNTHGLGCTLSAAITSYLAQGYTIKESVQSGKKYLTESLKDGSQYTLGHTEGRGPVNHFYQTWNMLGY